MKNFKLFLILLPIFAFVLLSCGLFEKEETASVKDPSQLEEGEKVTLVGRVTFYMEGDFYFHLEDMGQEYTIFISRDDRVNMGDYVEVKGVWEKEINGLSSESIKKLSEDEKRAYFESRYPFLEIKVLEYPKSVSHTCYTPKFKLEVTNSGKETISHKDLHTEAYDFGFYYFLNDSWTRANANRENYTEVKEQVNEEEKALIGLLSEQGFLYFEDIKPGQTREIEYWAGGQITKTELGTAGSPNIFGNQSVGEVDVSFGWARHNNYDPIFLYKTEPNKINLLSDRCDMGL